MFRNVPPAARRFHADRTPNFAYWYAGKLQTLAEVLARRSLRRLDWTLARDKRSGTHTSPKAEWRPSFRSGWQSRRRAFFLEQLHGFSGKGRKLRRRHRAILEAALRPGGESLVARARRLQDALRGRVHSDSTKVIRANRGSNYGNSDGTETIRQRSR